MAHRYLLGLGSAAVIAAASLSSSAITEPAAACAAPREWDIGTYDSCIRKVVDRNIRGETNDAQMLDEAKNCCLMSGGEWDIHAGGPNGECVAPAAAPGAVVPPGVATHTLEPAPPPIEWNPDVTQTFVPIG